MQLTWVSVSQKLPLAAEAPWISTSISHFAKFSEITEFLSVVNLGPQIACKGPRMKVFIHSLKNQDRKL